MTSTPIGGNTASDVAVGANGYLYLVGGAQSVLGCVTGDKPIPEQAFQRFTTNLEGRLALSSKIGAKYIHCVCPDKHSVIPEYFPFEIQTNVGEAFRKRCGSTFLQPVEELRRCDENFGYLKTDTHWNFAGRLAVCRAVLSGLNIDESEFAVHHEALTALRKSHTRYSGDLGSKLDPPAFEDADVSINPDRIGNVQMFTNSISGNNGLINVFFNTGCTDRTRLLVFGDSFIFHCLQMLALFFRETFFLRSPYLHSELVDSFQPTHIVTSNAERYLPNTTRDIDAPLGLLMAGLAGKTWNCDARTYQAINALLQPQSAHNRNFWSELRSS